MGRKPISIYITRAITILSAFPEVRVIARGRFVAKAISVATRLARATGCRYEVKIDEEEFQSDDQTRRVAKIEIRLLKPQELKA